ncbi:methyltransferase domain-containing protein [Streptomyces coffeae]|uniref:Protein-L-isoaspartate O-methyltransferase n=1 Tax=Streptomyces coffeae TaxID=621382 RepID=A0ABS1NQ94_9ACTN|nr:methyltransferase domain-containing protein [Streptomyces coffeae]MBL1102025.1 methyltransferase domain-containing protein [Streptomyces coffeae]
MPGSAALVEQLAEDGHLPTGWRDALTYVDRARFIPDRIWTRGPDGYQPLDKADDPDHWHQLVYSDIPLVTQVEDPPGTAVAQTPSSSASMPRIVTAMLAALDIHDGQRVLEIGAGTGYNAALLAHRLGDHLVTTIEVDPDLANRAHTSLKNAGYSPTVITGDGSQGWPDGTPYDRVIATCSVHHIPPAWIEQTTPGGIIVLPWGTTMRNGALVQLTVAPGGHTASGPVLGDTAFMWMRAQAPSRNVLAVAASGSAGVRSRTTLDPHFLSDDDAWFAAGVLVPGCQQAVGHGPDGAWTLWLADTADGSWASVDYEPEAADFEVEQYGPRRLWDELEAAHDWWTAAGRPARTRFGLTVAPPGQHVWLDQPDNPVPTLP